MSNLEGLRKQYEDLRAQQRTIIQERDSLVAELHELSTTYPNTVKAAKEWGARKAELEAGIAGLEQANQGLRGPVLGLQVQIADLERAEHKANRPKPKRTWWDKEVEKEKKRLGRGAMTWY